MRLLEYIAMLEFWFNPQTPLFKKLMILMIAIIVAIVMYINFPMPITLIYLFLSVGIIFLICRWCKLNITRNNPRQLLYRVFIWIPLALLCAIIFMKAQQNLLTWGIEGIAFMVISICICSPQTILKKCK